MPDGALSRMGAPPEDRDEEPAATVGVENAPAEESAVDIWPVSCAATTAAGRY